ncbi:MAG: AAA family ATPase [Patescibacteria group bacterium]
MIKKIKIQNYKLFQLFTLDFNSDLNILVGNNEVGKSTILEAINLALTKKINGRFAETELSPYLFNKECVNDYLSNIYKGGNPDLPKIIIELYFSEIEGTEILIGNNNSEREDCPGVKVEITFDEDYRDDYSKLLENRAEIKMIPTEYYKIYWHSFANKSVAPRSFPVNTSFIDATSIRLQSGTDYYLQNIINSGLEAREKVALAITYRSLKEKFSDEPSIKGINDKLTERKGVITDKDLAISIDISQKANWETNLVPHLDGIPFQLAGQGEQNALKIMLALERQADKSDVILIEEPENHLSFSSMNKLISKIKNRCGGKQIFITTHSAYVLNKLGIDKLIFIYNNNKAFLRNLPIDTQNYFKKLSGYDTLRLILANKSILVEGPSDELLIQKAYIMKYGKLPIEDGVDVINVRGLSFTRFLDIAKELGKDVVVVTDNDHDYQKNVIEKYEAYIGTGRIKVCSSDDNKLNTLEPNIVACNDIAVLNKIFGTKKDKKALVQYMENNKTDCALKIFESEESINMPDYVNDAIS